MVLGTQPSACISPNICTARRHSPAFSQAEMREE